MGRTGAAIACAEAGQGDGCSGHFQQLREKGTLILIQEGESLDLVRRERQPVNMPARRLPHLEMTRDPCRNPARATRRAGIGIPARQQARRRKAEHGERYGPRDTHKQHVGPRYRRKPWAARSIGAVNSRFQLLMTHGKCTGFQGSSALIFHSVGKASWSSGRGASALLYPHPTDPRPGQTGLGRTSAFRRAHSSVGRAADS